MAKTQRVVFSFDERSLESLQKDQGPGPVLVDGRGCARFPADQPCFAVAGNAGIQRNRSSES